MKSTNVKFSWLLLLFLMSIVNDVFSQQFPDGKNEIVKDQGIMDCVYAKIITDYVEEVNPEKLMRMGIDGMTSALDPFSKYYAKSEAYQFREQISGRFGGTGMLISQIGTQIVIRQIYQGDPADKAGLKPGMFF